MEPPQYYSRFSDTVATCANLPHWSQRCACFVTFRLADSLPQGKLAEISAERASWLTEHPQPWDEAVEREYFELFGARVQQWLDAGHGSCVLARPGVREIMEGALRHFADERYSLYSYVVMPNHVHVLFMPSEGRTVSEIVQAWKSASAHRINKCVGRTGGLWQKESWDRLVRNVAQFDAYRSYIVQNAPSRAYDVYQ